MKRWLIFAVKGAISVLLIWWLVGRIDPAQGIEVLARVSVVPLALALATMSLMVLCLALRWNAVNIALDIAVGRARTLRIILIGLFFSQTLPATIGGDVVRVWYVYRDGHPMERAISSVFSDRLIGLAALLAIVALLLPATFSLAGDLGALWSLATLVVVGLGGFLVLLALGGNVWSVLQRWSVTRSLLVLARDARRVLFHRTGALRTVILSVTIHLLGVVAVWFIAWSVAADISLWHCMVFVPPVILISMVPISVAGWGVRESAMVVAFGFVGVPEANALVISLIFGLTLVVFGALGGGLWLSDRPAVRDVFRLARAEK